MKGEATRARLTAGGNWVAMGARWSALVILAAAAVLFPLVFSSPVITNYGVFALIFVTAASAWNLFSGFSGYISLGQAVFFGSGAYAVGIAAKGWNVTGIGVFGLLPLAAVVGAAIAVPFGLVALRVRRHTFIVITIAVFFIFQLMAFNFSFTGGSSGLPAPSCPGRLPPTTTPSTTSLWPVPSPPSSWPGWSGGPGSACTCGRSGTTRTAPGGSGCGRCG